jgi:hypothetical protein
LSYSNAAGIFIQGQHRINGSFPQMAVFQARAKLAGASGSGLCAVLPKPFPHRVVPFILAFGGALFAPNGQMEYI